jgi:RHS repeat-associated protein
VAKQRRDRDTDADGTLNERLYVSQDANYNVSAIFDNSGTVVERYVYDPFGQATILDASWNVLAASAFAWVYLHQGGRFDTTSGLYHFRHRDYSPTLGRWTSLDPLRYHAGDVNLYRVVFNAPTNFTDPSGQIAWVPIIVAVVIIAGASGGVTGYVTGEGPSTAGSFIPGWGAGRSAGAHFSRGNYWRGTGYTALAVSDVFLVRSVATNFARVGLRGSVPGTMSVYRETGLYRLSGEPTAHYFWSVSGRQPYPYYHAINTVHNGRAGLFVLGSETAGLGGHQYSRIFWSLVLNTGMAGIGRHGYPATNCFTAWISAVSAGNYHLVPYVGMHAPATIWLPEPQNLNAGQARESMFVASASQFSVRSSPFLHLAEALPNDPDPEPYVDPVMPSRASVLAWEAWRTRNRNRR